MTKQMPKQHADDNRIMPTSSAQEIADVLVRMFKRDKVAAIADCITEYLRARPDTGGRPSSKASN
jgi:hypothetical protein